MKKNNIKFLALLLITTFVFSIVGVPIFAEEEKQELEPVDGGIINIALNRTVSAKALDPLYVDSTAADQILQQIGDTLVRTNKEQTETIPNIATSWEISEDGKDYTFKIRDDVYFHPGKYQNGRKLTADDVVYSVLRAKDYWCNYLYFLEDVEKIDETTVVCHLENPNATFLRELTSSSVVMVPKEEVEGWGEEFGMHFVGTGPFMLKEHLPDQKTELVRFDNYWGIRPHLDGAVYHIITDAAQTINAMMTGEIDLCLNLTGEGIKQVQDAENLVLIQGPENRLAQVEFNTSDEILKDERVRRALIHAVDYEQVAMGSMTNGTGTVNYLPLPKGSWGYNEEMIKLVPEYNPEKAKELLKEAGYEDGLELTINCVDSPERIRAMTIIQTFWDQVGVKAKIRTVSQAELTSLYTDASGQVTAGSQGGTSDPATFIGYYFATSKMRTNYNPMMFSDPQVDEWINEALEETNQERRKELYDKVLEAGIKANVGMFYADVNQSWGASNKVHGIVQEAHWVQRLVGTEEFPINVWKEQ